MVGLFTCLALKKLWFEPQSVTMLSVCHEGEKAAFGILSLQGSQLMQVSVATMFWQRITGNLKTFGYSHHIQWKGFR